MKVNIFGVARSGTTALYSLVQEIMLDNHKKIDFIYEPFLWDKDVFNDRYANKSHNFKYMHSLSFEGIVNHLQLPLFIRETDEYVDNSYISKLLEPANSRKNILTKFVRTNGRYNLIQKACPECKSIIVIRNPVDTINSVVNSFSFYGGEFHRDDFSRFINEINELYTDNLNINVSQDMVEKEGLYWYYMTRFILETIDSHHPEPLVLCHEELMNSREETIIRICKYLGYEYNERYVKFNEKKQGLITEQYELPQKDLDVLTRYLYIYFQLLDKYKIEYKFNKKSILKKYSLVKSREYSKKFYGYIPLRISREYDLLKQDFDNNNDLIKEKDELINSYNDDLKVKRDEIEKLNQDIQINNEELLERQQEIEKLIQDIQIKNEELEKSELNLNDVRLQAGNLEIELKKQSAKIKEYEKSLIDHTEKINHLNDLVTNKDNVISGLNQRYKKEIQEKNQQLEEIDNSYSWKIGRFITKMIGFFMFWRPGDKKQKPKDV